MVLELFQWAERTPLGDFIRSSLWLFPVIEAVHLLGLCLLGGAILIVDLRLLGTGLRSTSAAQLSVYARPWLRAAILVLVSTGVLLFFSEAVKLYYSTSFWVKITTLPLALAFTMGIRDRLIQGAPDTGTLMTRLAGLISITLWVVVAAAGRWIGFSS